MVSIQFFIQFLIISFFFQQNVKISTFSQFISHEKRVEQEVKVELDLKNNTV